MPAPAFYANDLPAVEKTLGTVQRGSAREFGRSAGNRPLWAVEIGTRIITGGDLFDARLAHVLAAS